MAFCGDFPSAGGLAIDVEQAAPLLIGRGERLALRLGESGEESRLTLPDRRASERHALVERQRDGYVLEDLGSTNGTFLRGTATKQVSLEDGTPVVVGRSVLLFKRGVENALLGPPQIAAPVAGVDVIETLAPALFQGLRVIAKSATSRLPLVILGETGTGKEIAARTAHRLSGRPGAFIAVNCGSLPESLAESELFGHRKGAFSGAATDHDGLVRASDQGTLFLDEIAELPTAVQVKFLRVLQEREVTPVGATRPEPVDFRLISASQQDLAALVSAGRFRADLLGRLSGPQVTLPPLRERLVDMGVLVAALLRRHA
ncbi:MAG TPA: sigma-54-dependent Fis family transcriptional regulator, partial [Polyangia bacterium]|nr:sigma-54-dependent Fis family transcriptional regulator [Polyangia bacterium]